MTRKEAAAMDELVQSVGLIVGLLRPQLASIKKLAAMHPSTDPSRQAALAILAPIFAAAAHMVDTHDHQMAMAKAALAAAAEMK